jgi:hypothetical protein
VNKLPNHTALKEWSTVVDALGRGDQVILIRKGGIADARFGVEADRFYLYPTYFHQGGDDQRQSVTISHWCEVVRTWRVREIEVMRRLEPLVASLPKDTLEERYRFRPDQALHVIGVRTFRLAAPVDVQVTPEYQGCRSWISVEEEIDVSGSKPVLSDAEMQAKIATVEALLTQSSVLSPQP